MNVNIYSSFLHKRLINKYFEIFNSLYETTNQLLKVKNNKSVDVNFVSNRYIKRINQKYRNINKVTDVISFAFDESAASSVYLGEIYISYKKAKQQAKKYHHSINREVCFLFVHGLLHLYGYDHMNKKDEKIMFNLQEKILNKCKIYRS